MTVNAPASSLSRQQLLEVLVFLERRGASPDVLSLAMTRAGIHHDVARLLAQCIDSGQLQPLDISLGAPPALPAPATATTAPHPARTAPRPDVGGRVLGYLARLTLVWATLLVGGLALGFAVGMDIGIAQGVEQGLDRLQLALQF